MFDLSGKTAVVIGAASGIGRESARGLAAFGANVVAADLNGDAAAEVAEQIRAEGGNASSQAVDFTDPQQVEELVRSVDSLDVLVVTPSINVRKPMLSISLEEFDRVVDLNLKGSFVAVAARGRRMAGGGQGGGSRMVSGIRRGVVGRG